jgi:hypothetical protein
MNTRCASTSLRAVIFASVVLIPARFTWSADEPKPDHKPVEFSFKDQFDNDLVLKPPFDKPVVVTIADQRGAEQLDAWVQPLKREFGDRIRFFAIADVQGVPGPLRGLVRRGFKKDYRHPVALDWRGQTAARLTVKADIPNLVLLDHGGRPRTSVSGPAGEEPVQRLLRELKALLAEPPPASSP